MAGEGAPGAIVLGAGGPRLASAATRSGWLRSWVMVLLVGGVAVLGCVAALLTLHGGTVGRATMARHGLESLPLTAQGPVSAALGRDEAGYRIKGFVARNPAQRLSARFARSGVAVTAHAARFAIALRAFGRGDALRSLAPVSPVVSANRVSYARGSLREWWTNGPLGLEQGFDIARRPAGSGALTFSLAMSGSVRLDHGTVLLPGGLRYVGVRAADADGRALPAWLQVHAGRVLVRVDDRGARYPVHVDPFVQQAELTPSDGAEHDFFGFSVAVSGDTIVIGAPLQNVGSIERQGAAYVFTMPPGGWAGATQTAELTANDAAEGDQLGASVAIDGNTIVVGSAAHRVGSNSEQGAAYVFVMPPGGWKSMTQTAELTAGDGAFDDQFGNSVAISGDTVVVGALNHEVGANTWQGAAYVFTMPAGGWENKTQTAELTAGDGAKDDHLGDSVAVSGSTIVAGAFAHKVGSHASQGAAYVFTMPAGGWENKTQTAELTANDGVENDVLGTSVAISGDTIVAGAIGAIGSRGAAYVFTMPAGGWESTTQTAELIASDGSSDDRLGTSVAIAGNTVLAGALNHPVGSNAQQGAVYAFVMPAGGWETTAFQTAEMTAGNGAAEDYLGTSVAISASTILAGAPDREVDSNRHQGAAYVFSGLAQSVAPPSVTIATPVNSGVYNQGQVVDASYSCAAAEGATISSCSGPVAGGTPIDTSTAGAHTFTVTATDNLGQSTSSTANYTVVSPTSSPTSSPTGSQGSTGPRQSIGSTGPAGPAPKNGEVELVTCKSVTTGRGKNKKTVQKCTIKLTSSPVTITTTGGSVKAVLSRGKIVYATGSAVVSGKHTKLLLTPRRSIGNGTYTLTLTHGHKRRRETITID